MTTEQSLKVLSLNCWGLKYVAKNRVERIRAIAEVLAASDYDIVGLQELWVQSDFQHVRNAVLKNLPYSKYFHSGALGSGLAVFTRYPIVGSSIHPYALNGSPLDVAGGDFFVGKSVTSVILEHPTLGELEVFNTHMYAKGGEIGEESRRAHRIVGAMQVAKLFRASARQGRYIVATGDFNSVPTSLTIDIIRSHGGVQDAFASSRGPLPYQTDSARDPEQAIRDFGVTADSPINSYSAGKHLDSTAQRFQGKRLDYVFFRDPYVKEGEPTHTLACTQTDVVMTAKVPGRPFSYSDHFGLEATIEIRLSSSLSPQEEISKLPPELLHNGFASSAPSVRSLAFGASSQSLTTGSQLPPASVTTAINALTAAYREARRRSNLQLAGFASCILAAVGLIVGSAWQPWATFNPLLTFVAVAVGWAGTTLLYSGFIYGNYETNMLVNAIEELEMLRSQLLS